MHEIYLDNWHQKMSYWGTKADELAIYALSDMLQIHSFIVTKNRPWTTVDASVCGTDMEILHLCPVKLAYLGENRFGRLWKKLWQDPLVSTNQTNQPAFPDLMPPPIVSVPAPPTIEELETTETLLTIPNVQPKTQGVLIELQEPTTTNIQYSANDVMIDNTFTLPDPTFCLGDAMDKIVEHEDVSFSEPRNWVKFCDCMDLVTGRINDIVNFVNFENIAKLGAANVQRIETLPCWVELVRIKPTPTVRLPSLQTTSDLLALNEYFTRSRNKPKPKQKNRRPRHASTNINYAETEVQSDVDERQKQLKSRTFPPPADGPSQTRIASQDNLTIAPDVCLPPVETENLNGEDEPPPAELPSVTINTPDPAQAQSKPKPKQRAKGTFATKSFILKKVKRKRNYGCKLCEAVLSSAHQLTVHHWEKHGILYCETCNKAFNNMTSLVRHKYQHCELRFRCNCGVAFAFASQLQTHCGTPQACHTPLCLPQMWAIIQEQG